MRPGGKRTTALLRKGEGRKREGRRCVLDFGKIVGFLSSAFFTPQMMSNATAT